VDRIRVLLVDDHAVLRDGLRALLNMHDDIEVVAVAGDGREAIDLVRHYAPDVVVMDMAMPGMEGLEATRRIVEERPQTRVLVLSQHDNERYILPVLQAGAMGYVLKRAASDDLVTAIRLVYRGDPYLPPLIAKVVLRDYRQHTGPEAETEDYGLTAREKEVLKLVAEGRTSREIAELLYVSNKTVMSHRANIYKKLGTHNRTELVKYAIRRGLIEV
jgi:DNA-binding NarL/FixJ family response regulator